MAIVLSTQKYEVSKTSSEHSFTIQPLFDSFYALVLIRRLELQPGRIGVFDFGFNQEEYHNGSEYEGVVLSFIEVRDKQAKRGHECCDQYEFIEFLVEGVEKGDVEGEDHSQQSCHHAHYLRGQTRSNVQDQKTDKHDAVVHQVIGVVE